MNAVEQKFLCVLKWAFYGNMSRAKGEGPSPCDRQATKYFNKRHFQNLNKFMFHGNEYQPIIKWHFSGIQSPDKYHH